jgi:hypothetical protein
VLWRIEDHEWDATAIWQPIDWGVRAEVAVSPLFFATNSHKKSAFSTKMIFELRITQGLRISWRFVSADHHLDESTDAESPFQSTSRSRASQKATIRSTGDATPVGCRFWRRAGTVSDVA